MYGCEDLTVFLLEARADTEIRNHRGLRPVDIAKTHAVKQLIADSLLLEPIFLCVVFVFTSAAGCYCISSFLAVQGWASRGSSAALPVPL